MPTITSEMLRRIEAADRGYEAALAASIDANRMARERGSARAAAAARRADKAFRAASAERTAANAACSAAFSGW